jgi:SAM-dependent methyltransferase
VTPNALRTYRVLPEMIEALRHIANTLPASDGQREMCNLVLESDTVARLVPLDPFGPEYANVCRDLHREISGVSGYDPAADELTNGFDIERSVREPTPYNFGDSAAVGDFFLSWGAILQALDVKRGQSVIEYGAGEGQISIALARLGCDVNVVDVEQRYLDSITRQCERLDVRIRTHKGFFGDRPDNRCYDRVVFFEAFHHAFDHRALARRLHDVIAPGGFVVFSGEPIIEDSPYVPFPWGPRLDGLSVFSMNSFGWMELGFKESYFVEMLMRAGWLVARRAHPMTFRGNCYVARPRPARIEAGMDFLIAFGGHAAGWDVPEGTHRWTHGDALFPLDDRIRSRPHRVTVTLTNHLPVHREVEISCGRHRASATLAPGSEEVLTVDIDDGAPALRIASNASRVMDVIPQSTDSRVLGVAVNAIAFDTRG